MIKLEKMREDRRLSKSELARRSNVDISFISYAENRGFRLYDSQLRRLSDALGYQGAEPSDLLQEVGDDARD